MIAVPGSARRRAAGTAFVAASQKYLGPVNNYPIAALLPEIVSGKARGEKFGYSK